MTVDQRVTDVENVDAVSATVTVKGTDAGQRPQPAGLRTWAVGRAGADTIDYGVDLANAPALTCTGASMVARGGKDADTVSGTSGNDRLFGNKGEDLVQRDGRRRRRLRR